MKYVRFIAALSGLLAIAALAADASAMYNPTQGRFLQRDPGGTILEAPMAGTLSGSQYTQHDPTAQYDDGMNLYQYVRSNSVGYNDPSGLRKGPGVVKQVNGPDGAGEFSAWSLFRNNLFRPSHVVVDDTGKIHRFGHTFIAMGESGGDPSYGFYPARYKDAWVTLIPGVTVASIIPGFPGNPSMAALDLLKI